MKSGDNKKKKGYVKIDFDWCKGCHLCIEVCPQKVLQVAKVLNSQSYYPAEFNDNDEKCKGCALCAMVCPEAIIEVFRE